MSTSLYLYLKICNENAKRDNNNDNSNEKMNKKLIFILNDDDLYSVFICVVVYPSPLCPFIFALSNDLLRRRNITWNFIITER